MTITRTHLAVRIRTLTLVAGTTALGVFLGALAGDAFLWVFAALALAASLAGYFYSDRLALHAAQARPLTEQQAPEVHAVLRELSACAGIRTPRLYVMPAEPPKAFATGRGQHRAAIALTTGLLLDLPLHQVRGVLAHELAHLKNRDLLTSALVATIAGVISAIVLLEFSLVTGAGAEQNAIGFLGWLALVVMAPLGAMLLQLRFSRQREYQADATAARLLDSGRPLADALQQIERDRTRLVINPVSAPMFTVTPLGGWRLRSLFSTHPPVAERIRRLRAHKRQASPIRRLFGAPARPSAALVVAGALALAGCGAAADTRTSTTSPAAPAPAAQTPTATSAIPKIVERVQPQVVTVLSGKGLGSGVIYRSDGVILTNEHVIRGNTDVAIAFADGSREPGRVMAKDADTDLALIRVDRKDLPAASFQTALPPVGSQAVVLGSPLGFEKSVTAGIVSGLHRAIPGSAGGSAALVDLMQTDAPISPGSSGGAVVDAQGRVIGISEAYIPPEQGAVAIGFAIPAATAVSVANQLLEKGKVEHAFIGIQPAQLTPELAQQLGVQQSSGVLVYGVSRGGPADVAGIEPGDILLSVAGKSLSTVEDLFVALRQHKPGQRLSLERVHDGKQGTVSLLLSAKPQ